IHPIAREVENHLNERHCLHWDAPIFESEIQSDWALPSQGFFGLVLHSRSRLVLRAQLDLPSHPETRRTTQPDQLVFCKKSAGDMAKLCTAFRKIFDSRRLC